MRDMRDPEKLGVAMSNLKRVHPELSACARADLIDDSYRMSTQAIAAGNGFPMGSDNGKVSVNGIK